MGIRRQIEQRLRKLEERRPPDPNAEPTEWELDRATKTIYDPLTIRYLASRFPDSQERIESLLEQGDFLGVWTAIRMAFEDDYRSGTGVS